MKNTHIVIAYTEYAEKDFSFASSQEKAEEIALEFAKEGYFPEVYKLGEHIPVKAVDDFFDSEYNTTI